MKWQRVKYQPNTPLGADGQKVTASKAHTELSKQAAKEGMVLLKNESGLLPFEKGTRLAVFGKASADYVKGGGGSGDVTVSYTVSLDAGLKALSDYVSVYEGLSSFYNKNVRDQYEKGVAPGMTVEPEVPADLLKKARAYTDTALITICRFSGEGWDRTSSYDNGVESGEPMWKESQKVFERGDFYLSDAEQRMVETVKAAFPKVVVVLNVGGVVDSMWFADDPQIQSVLMAWQGGIEGGAAAELLCGIGSPSGKLADTFAKTLEDYPSSYNFHESQNYVDYTDDIYVGYRYFETIPGADKKVVYPFGYGLSYTTFKWELERVDEAEDGTLTVRAEVTNTGNHEGKEVLQLYGSAPKGALDKPAKILLAYAKTKLLQPGENQLVTLTANVNDLASYDDLGVLYKSAYVMEQGEYHFYLGNSVRNTEELGFIHTEESTRVAEQLTECLAPTSLSKRMRADGSFEELPVRPAHDPDSEGLLTKKEKEANDGVAPDVRFSKGEHLWNNNERRMQFEQVAEGSITLDEFVAQLSNEELAHLLGGQPNTGVANTFGFGNLPECGIPNFMTADGPAGLRILPECGVCTTAWPCATLLACTWNPEIVYEVGAAGAKEVKENNIAVWLTPAINIHRTPMCGRNFEYYSEDPYLVAKQAGAMVRGIQSQHVAATVKHFALNNKETNRKDSNSRVSERAARQIYLKTFERIVKEAKPWCIMSSYNIVNDYRASENHDLLEKLLRDEWGFEGVVMTDWWTFGEHCKEVNAGNDVKMAAGNPDNLLKALEKGLLKRETMECSVKRLLGVLLKID